MANAVIAGVGERLLDEVPYSSVYVEPDEFPGVRLPALMVGDQQEFLAVGLPVELQVPADGPIRASGLVLVGR